MISRRILIIASYLIMGIVSFSLVLAGIIIMLQSQENLLGYNEIITDLEEIGNISSLKTFKPGELINVKNKVEEVYYFQFEEDIYKLVVFDGFRNNKFQLCLIGAQGANCSSGSDCEFLFHVESYTISGQEVIWLREWYNFYNIFFGIENYLTIDFDKDITPILNELSEISDVNNIQTLSSGLSMQDITGYTNPDKTIIEYLAITIRPKAGIKELDLNSLNIKLESNQYNNTLNFNKTLLIDFNKSYTTVIFNTPVKQDSDKRIIDFLNDEDFGVIISTDQDESMINNKSVTRNDRFITIVNISSLIPDVNGLMQNEKITAYIKPSEGVGDEFEITAPSNFPIRIVKF